MKKSSPILSPLPPAEPIPAEFTATGLPVAPIDRLRIMSPKAWTDFTLEWADSLKSEYETVERCDGAGDMGRDVIAFEKNDQSDPWDNYQCKYYDHQLAPGDIWLELGKLCYYTHIGEYSVPRRYYFVAPHGAGPSLSSLLRSPNELRDGLLENWDTKCQYKITSTKEVLFDSALASHIMTLDFSIFRAPSPLKIIEAHRQTPWHTSRFGGGLRARPAIVQPPVSIADYETNYIRALLDAYEDRLKTALSSTDQVTDAQLVDHLRRARLEFYSAEALKGFSRETVPPGTFDMLLDEVLNGVIDVVQATHPDAFERLLATVGQAKSLPLSASPLAPRILSTDKGGMCHQLANEKIVRWRP